MDLIYTDANRADVGVLHDYAFDLAYGLDENDFELALANNKHCCGAGCLVYIEGTEYGGIIDGIKTVTKDKSITYKGRTWHGMLGKKIIEPDTGQDYLVLSGEANSVISSLLTRLGLNDLFTASAELSGLNINNYSMDRYIDAYSGICKMLAKVSGKLKFTFKQGKIELAAIPAVDYSKDEQFDSDQVELEIDKTYNAVNHLICLGKGDLKDRKVIHLYADAKGNISENQTFTGLEEVTAVYDYSNVESPEELRKSGIEELKKHAATDIVKMNFASEGHVYDIGDIVGAKEITTGISATEKITKKTVTIRNGKVNIEYKVGEAN